MTDARGRDSVRLAPGRWTARASAGMQTVPTPLVFAASATRDFSIDTGVR